MKLYEAIAYRINKLCEEKNISINKLASMSCLTQSTIQHLVDHRHKNVKDFYDDPVFDNIDRED